MKKDRKKHLRRLADRREARRQERSSRAPKVSGILKMAQGGFGFVAVEPEGSAQKGKPPEEIPDVFIPAKFVGEALDGDTVQVELLPPRHGVEEKGPAGRIIAVLDRPRDEIVCEILAGNIARPLNPRLPDEIELTGPRHGAKRGDWVKLRLEYPVDGVWQGHVIRVIGRSGMVCADLDAVMAEFELAPRYSETEDAEAALIVPREIPREDLTSRWTVTIDPFDAKDFDDALSIAPGSDPDTVELGVHISDVASFIEPKSKFDRQAAKRGFSCYLPGRTLPMLPPKLTAAISMQAGAKSRAHSVIFTVDRRDGRILASRRVHSFVRVDHRLNYEEVQTFIDKGEAPAAWDDVLKQGVSQLLDVTRKLRKQRALSERFIDLPLPEIRVLCDEGANLINGLSVKISRESEAIVEECMLAANSAVGAEMAEKGIAGIYRVHPEPDPERASEFCDMMEQNFGLVPGDVTNRDNCIKFIHSLPDDPKRQVILGMLLRSLPRAGYAEKGLIHFALGKKLYSHFTSPIRRYSDLTVHQQLWNFDSGNRTRPSSSMAKIAETLCDQEENNDAAYYAASDRLKLRYLEQRLEAGDMTVFEGIITRVLTSGMQVDIQELGLYGYVPLEALGGQYSRSRGRMAPRQGRGGYKVGDFIYLRLGQIDFAKGQAVFVPVGR